jgi:hypothetical protein
VSVTLRKKKAITVVIVDYQVLEASFLNTAPDEENELLSQFTVLDLLKPLGHTELDLIVL